MQVDNDGDGLFDEDPVDGINNDGDSRLDEDPDEPGKNTYAIDCDARVDEEVRLQIRDTDPRSRVISTQEWFIRAVGKPETNFAFWSNAEQVVCTIIDDPDGIPDTGDEVVECTWSGDWIELAYVNLALEPEGCVKQVKPGGPGVKQGGKTPFCDITDAFLVDVDTDGVDGADLFGEFVFSISCLDVEGTLEDESLTCPLSRIIWDVDEEETTSKAKAQIFVSHTGTASIKGGKICKGNNCTGDD